MTTPAPRLSNGHIRAEDVRAVMDMLEGPEHNRIISEAVAGQERRKEGA